MLVIRPESHVSIVRIYIGAFTLELGGQRAADIWAHRVKRIMKTRALWAATPISGVDGILATSDLHATAQEFHDMED